MLRNHGAQHPVVSAPDLKWWLDLLGDRHRRRRYTPANSRPSIQLPTFSGYPLLVVRSLTSCRATG